MAQQNINVGATGNDGTGDDLRTAGTKINNNFSELYGDVSVLQATAGIGGSGLSFDSGGIRFEGATADSHETLLIATDPTKDNTLQLPDSSGELATVSRITQIVDSAYVSFITGTAFDSASTITLIRNNSVDSAHTLLLIDSAYIQLRQVTSTFDSNEVTDIVDSNYVKAFADSAYVKGFIDSSHVHSVVNILDSAAVLSIADSSQLDSADIIQMIDSSYTQTRVDVVNLRNYTVATAPSTPPHGTLIFCTNGNSGAQCLAVYDSNGDSAAGPGYFRRIALGAEIST
tara:strand:- start:628 stop:1488 length:861 start_codon:yes stop_codon:yes gene_type:complete